MNSLQLEREINKIYFTITDVSKIIGITIPTTRFWMKAFEIPFTVSKKRLKKLTEKSLIKLSYVYFLLYTRHFTMKGAMLEVRMNGWPDKNTLSVMITDFTIKMYKPDYNQN